MKSYSYGKDEKGRIIIRVATHNHDSVGEVMACCKVGVSEEQICEVFARVHDSHLSRRDRMRARKAALVAAVMINE